MTWLGRLFGRKALERDLDRELQFHLDAAVADHMRSGLTRDAALRLARIEIGGLEQVKEYTRDARGTRWVEDVGRDTAFALRALRRSPGFTMAAVLTLAVGIGANTAVWNIVNALMLRSLPVDRPEELNAIKRVGLDDEGHYLVSHPLLLRMQSALPDSVHVAAMGSLARMYATIGEQPEPVIAQFVSGNWFNLLGVTPQAGRVLTANDDRTVGAHPVAVISDGFLQRRFGGDPSILGKVIRLNGAPLTVVGIARPGFAGLYVGSAVDVWVPLMMQHDAHYPANASSSNSDTEKPWVPQNGVSWLTLVTRVTPTSGPPALARLQQTFRADLTQVVADRDSASRTYAMREHLELEPIERGFSALRQQFADPLKVLMASVALVLLIACGNMAGLLLARSAARTHEIAIRISLGAQPGRLVRQILTESLTLAVIGGVLSLFVAHWGSLALLKLASTGTRGIPLAVAIDAPVLAFATGVSLVVGLLFGLAPALGVARTDLYDSFKTGGRVVAGGSHRLPLGRVLVASQIALSLVLVTSAALFVRTFQNYLNIDPGYEREHVITARIDTRAAGYTYAQLPALHQRLIDAVGGLPGVRSVSLSLNGMMGNSRRLSSFVAPDHPLPPGQSNAQENYVSPAFFSTIGTKVLRGRAFTDADRDGAPKVVVLSQGAAKFFFGKDDVVGLRIGYGTPPEFEIVGVVSDARVNGLKDAPQRMVYHALAQGPQEFITSLEARVSSSSAAAILGVRTAVGNVDKKLPIQQVTTLGDLLERGLTRERLVARLAGGFGLLALLLAGIGLYGVIGYSVARRTNEMGVRLALGASPAGVSWVVLRDSLTTIAIGLVLGLALWYPVVGLTQRLVFGLSPRDPMTVVIASALLLTVGTLAAALPALRAARIDPVEAIRAQ